MTNSADITNLSKAERRLKGDSPQEPDCRFREIRIIAEIAIDSLAMADGKDGRDLEMVRDHALWLFEQVQRVANRGENGDPVHDG